LTQHRFCDPRHRSSPMLGKAVLLRKMLIRILALDSGGLVLHLPIAGSSRAIVRIASPRLLSSLGARLDRPNPSYSASFRQPERKRTPPCRCSCCCSMNQRGKRSSRAADDASEKCPVADVAERKSLSARVSPRRSGRLSCCGRATGPCYLRGAPRRYQPDAHSSERCPSSDPPCLRYYWPYERDLELNRGLSKTFVECLDRDR
jgi:hypothetical protein